MAQGGRFFEIAALMASAAIFVASCAMVLAGWNARSEILAWWVLLAFQLLFVLVATGTSVALSTWLVQTALAAAVNRVAALERSHGELMRAVTRRAPTGVAIAFLTGQVLVLIADKAFPKACRRR